ncbi:MAG: AI-2E family transporter [Desulfohalobiaceae bacterium]|nr:AI-2E family transporter [Desulfohalobiaceae bacterium]
MDILQWIKHHLADRQVVALLLLLGFIVVVFLTVGRFLTPIIVSLVLAYLLEGLIQQLEKFKVPRFVAVNSVFIVFMLAFLFLLLGLAPKLYRQIGQLVQSMPRMVAAWQDRLLLLPEKYPEVFTENQVNMIVDSISTQIGRLSQNILSVSMASVLGLIEVVVYIVLVPVVVYFFLKDKDKILIYFYRFLPENIDLAGRIWKDVNHKTARFIQGKIWETLIVWGVSYVAFFLLGLQYSILLSFLVGISVIVPYVGATVSTVIVLLVAFFQWGWGAHFAYISIALLFILVLDANLLVPLLLSEIVNLHPLAIIIGILVFGGMWGIWGVFFAIPLATLINAIIRAWPSAKQLEKSG